MKKFIVMLMVVATMVMATSCIQNHYYYTLEPGAGGRYSEFPTPQSTPGAGFRNKSGWNTKTENVPGRTTKDSKTTNRGKNPTVVTAPFDENKDLQASTQGTGVDYAFVYDYIMKNVPGTQIESIYIKNDNERIGNEYIPTYEAKVVYNNKLYEYEFFVKDGSIYDKKTKEYFGDVNTVYNVLAQNLGTDLPLENVCLEIDYDDGKEYYEGYVAYKGVVYEYKIDPTSMALVKWEVEY